MSVICPQDCSNQTVIPRIVVLVFQASVPDIWWYIWLGWTWRYLEITWAMSHGCTMIDWSVSHQLQAGDRQSCLHAADQYLWDMCDINPSIWWHLPTPSHRSYRPSPRYTMSIWCGDGNIDCRVMLKRF